MNGMMPIISIEMEGIKSKVQHLFQDHNDEMNAYIQGALEKTLNEEWVVKGIQESVDKMVADVINDIGNNYELKRIVKDIMVQGLSKSLQKQKD